MRGSVLLPRSVLRRRSARAGLVGGVAVLSLVLPFLAVNAAAASATLGPDADAYVSTSSKSSGVNYGSATTLRTSATKRSYVRFVVPAGSTPVTSAVLRLHASTSSSAGFQVSASSSAWTESTITGSNAPAVGALVGSSGPVTAGTWSSVDITPLVTAAGPVSVVVTGASGTSMTYSSRESGATAPQLVLSSGAASATPSPSPTPSPTASPTPSPTTSPAPAPVTSSYADAVRADGPIGYWRLGDPAGSAAADSSGNGRTGTYSGGVTHPAGAVGDGDTAAGFDGSTGKVSVADAAALRLNGSFSLEFWGRLDAFANTYPGLLVKGASSTADGYLVWYSSNGQLNFKRNNLSVSTPTGALTAGWRHYAVTYDGATLRWYVDGAQAAASARSYPASAGTAPLQLGRGDEFGKQSLDEVALYDRALTAAQVSGHRTAATSGGTTSPSPSPSASVTPSPSPTPTVGPVAPTVVVAAAGDMACDPTDANYNNGLGTASFCRQKATSDLVSSGGYDAILPLGDEQYTDGTLAKFNQVYDASWGRTKTLHRPVPGNHEYLDPNAAGYFDYYGAKAGERGKGWYSYNLGSWHVIALNSECSYVGGCAAGSPQETWLKADLAANPAACTLAYWHTPKFTSSDPTNTAPYQAFWNALQAAGADVVLNSHFHNYERFAPQTPSGVADPRGIREFVVGTGGKNLVGFGSTPLPTSEVRNSATFGVLQLALKSGSYDWKFVPEAGKTFTDSGTTSCH